MGLVEVVRDGVPWTFHVRRHGAGPPVLLLHGLLTDSRVWRPLRAALADRYTLLTVDAPGHGGSPPRAADFTLEAEADALVGLLDAVGVAGPVAWVGHSMGGMKALRAALAHPRRVAALGLISCQPYAEPARTAAPYLAMVETARTWGIDDGLAEAMGRLNFGRAFLATDAGRAWVRHFTTLAGDDFAATAHAVFHRRDVADRMGEVAAPALVLHGAQDIPIRIAVARAYAPALPGARLVELDGCGHTPPCERPAQTATLVGEFLDEVYRPAHRAAA